VLRASDRRKEHWQKITGGPVTEEEAKDLIAISMIMYHIYTCLGEAISFTQTLEYELNKFSFNPTRQFEVKKNWKAAYSSIYTSLNAMCNLSMVIAGNQSVFKRENGVDVWNYTPKDVIKDLNKKSFYLFSSTIQNCLNRLEIRNHLDHYWTIWTEIRQGAFKFDKDFSKGYVVTSPPTEGKSGIDGRIRLNEDIINTAKDFDTLFLELSRLGGSLDKYLNTKGIIIDYSDYGAPHDGQRPRL
jgi:hypothetical protein